MEPVVGRSGEQRRVVVFDRCHELREPAEIVDGVRPWDLPGERPRERSVDVVVAGDPHHHRRTGEHRADPERDHGAIDPRR